MKVGDLVKWIGFPGATLPPSRTGPKNPGIIVKVYKDREGRIGRLDVAWGDGSFGNMLYPGTVEIINGPNIDE